MTVQYKFEECWIAMARSRFSAWSIAFLTASFYASGTAAVEAYELIIPALEFRTGHQAPVGIPLWTGFSDYLTLLNERDGRIGGVNIKIPVCETAYDTKRGVECYEKLKGEALVIVPVYRDFQRLSLRDPKAVAPI